jgi:hypothetical protein
MAECLRQQSLGFWPAPAKFLSTRHSALRIERLLAKVEAESRARPPRYCFHFDEVAEAEAQGLPLRARTQGFEPRGMREEYSLYVRCASESDRPSASQRTDARCHEPIHAPQQSRHHFTSSARSRAVC